MQGNNAGPLIKRSLIFCAVLFVCYALLLRHSARLDVMGVKDLLAKLGDKQKGVPPPIPHATRPATGNDGNTVPRPGESSGKSFVVARNGNLQLEDGTPFRFASLNAPELLGGHEFEVEDTMRTLQGFGRRVTRSYTLSIAGTSPHVGDAVHVRGWDVSRRNWVYNEEQFKKVCCPMLPCKPRRARPTNKTKVNRWIMLWLWQRNVN